MLTSVELGFASDVSKGFDVSSNHVSVHGRHRVDALVNPPVGVCVAHEPHGVWELIPDCLCQSCMPVSKHISWLVSGVGHGTEDAAVMVIVLRGSEGKMRWREVPVHVRVTVYSQRVSMPIDAVGGIGLKSTTN